MCDSPALASPQSHCPLAAHSPLSVMHFFNRMTLASTSNSYSWCSPAHIFPLWGILGEPPGKVLLVPKTKGNPHGNCLGEKVGQKPGKPVKEQVDLTGKRNFSGTPHWHWHWPDIVWEGHTLLSFGSFSWSLQVFPPPPMPARQTQPRVSQARKAKLLLKMGGKASQQGFRGKQDTSSWFGGESLLELSDSQRATQGQQG